MAVVAFDGGCLARVSGGKRLPAGAHAVSRVRDAPALLGLGFTLGNYLVKFGLVERTDVREIRLSQVVQPAIIDLRPEPSAYDVLAVAYNCGRTALVAAYALENVAGEVIPPPHRKPKIGTAFT